MKKLLLFLTLFIITGCDGNLQDELTENNDTKGTNVMHSGDELPGRTMSDQNPNLLNTGSERNNRRDTDHARKVIEDTGEFTPDSIWINGDDLWVNAHTKADLTSKEKVDAQARLHKILMKALPDYDIEVKVNED